MELQRDTGIDPDKLYALREAVPLLKVTEQTIGGYLRSGKIEGKQIGPKNKWHVFGREIIRLRRKWGYE